MRFIKIMPNSDRNGERGNEILLVEPTYPNPYYDRDNLRGSHYNKNTTQPILVGNSMHYKGGQFQGNNNDNDNITDADLINDKGRKGHNNYGYNVQPGGLGGTLMADSETDIDNNLKTKIFRINSKGDVVPISLS